MNDKLIKVLLIEDDPGDARLIRRMLTEARGAYFDLKHTDRLLTGLEQLVAGDVEVALVDLALPDSRGLDTFVKAHTRAPQVPIIVLTGLDDEELAIEAVRQGAQDYLVKGQVDSNLLVRAMRYAIARQRAEEALQQHNRELASLNRANQAFNSILDLDQVLVTVLEEIHHLLDVVGSSVWLIDPETDELVCRQSSGLGNEVVRGWHLAPGAGIAGWTAAHGESMLVPDTRANERHFKEVDQQIGLELRSILSVPLRVKQGVIGVLQVVDTEVGRFDIANLALLEPLAASAAIAIENARLYDQARQEVAQRQRAEAALRATLAKTEALYHVARSLIGYESLPDLLQTVTDSVVEALPANSVLLCAIDQEKQQVTHFVKGGPGSNPIPQIPFAELQSGLSGWVLREQKPALSPKGIPDPRESPEVQRSRIEGSAGSIIVVPLPYQDRTLGTLTAINRSDQQDFTSQDVELMTAMANQAAMAITNAQLYEETARLKEFNESIVQGVAEAILIEDAQSILTFANPAAEELLGYAREELIGLHWSALVPEDETERVRQEVAKRLQGISSRYETALLSKEGQVIQVIVSARPLFEDGKFAGVLTALTDITARKEMEQQLIHTEKLSAIGQLSASIIHEVSNPIQVLIGVLGFALEDAAAGEDVQEYLQISYNEVLRIARTINRVHGFSKLGSGEERGINDVNNLVQQVLELTAQQCQHSKVEVVPRLAADLPLLEVVGDQVKQVFLNVVINALDAMPEGGRLEVRTAYVPQPPEVRVEFTDTGAGIDPQVLPRIFEPFFTTKEAGTGLGLSISKDIVEEHEGRMEVDTRLGGGTTFTIWFPARLKLPRMNVNRGRQVWRTLSKNSRDAPLPPFARESCCPIRHSKKGDAD